MIRSILSVGGWTLVSRVTGFARDVVMAAILGAGPVADAFVVNVSSPNTPGLRALQAAEDLHRLMIGVEPDRTFVIDLDPAQALARATGRALQQGRSGDADPSLASGTGTAAPRHGNAPSSETAAEDRFEGMGLGFQQRLRDGFRALALAHPARVRLIDGSGPAEAVAARVRAAL